MKRFENIITSGWGGSSLYKGLNCRFMLTNTPFVESFYKRRWGIWYPLRELSAYSHIALDL